MLTRRPARGLRIFFGALLLLLTANSSTKPPADPAEALGHLMAVVAIVFAAVWLIASGLPKWIGDPQFTRMRRRIWYKLAGVGLVVMVFLAVTLMALSQLTAAVLVTWAYWFGWTWIAWRIADQRAKERVDRGSVIPTSR